MKAVILAGGKGTRLAPYTRVFPKPMMPIGDKAILEILLYQMRRAGVSDVILTVGHMAGLMRAFFQNGEHLGLNICYSYEEHPLGTAGPLASADGHVSPSRILASTTRSQRAVLVWKHEEVQEVPSR